MRKKNYRKIIQKKCTNRHLRYLPVFASKADGFVGNRYNFLSRGVAEKRLWKKTMESFWLPEYAAGMLRQPAHRNVWLWPALPPYQKMWITLVAVDWTSFSYASIWDCLRSPTAEELQKDLERWIFNRMVIFSGFFAFIYGCSAFVAFSYLFTLLVLPQLANFWLLLQHSFWSVHFFWGYGLFFGCFVVSCLSVFTLVTGRLAAVTFKAFDAFRRRPRWDVCTSHARPNLFKVIRLSNSLRRLHLRNRYYFTRLGIIERLFQSNLFRINELGHALSLNYFHWEAKIRYHRPGKWFYNVTHNFWFDYYFNYAAFVGDNEIRDVELSIHPFLFIRQIMTDSAKPLMSRHRHWRLFLHHYAKGLFIWRVARISIWIGLNVLYRWRLAEIKIKNLLSFLGFGNFSTKKLFLRYMDFFDYNTYYSFGYLVFLTPLLPRRVVLSLLLYYASLTAVYSHSAFQFHKLSLRLRDFGMRPSSFAEEVLQSKLSFFFPYIFCHNFSQRDMYFCHDWFAFRRLRLSHLTALSAVFDEWKLFYLYVPTRFYQILSTYHPSSLCILFPIPQFHAFQNSTHLAPFGKASFYPEFQFFLFFSALTPAMRRGLRCQKTPAAASNEDTRKTSCSGV